MVVSSSAVSSYLGPRISATAALPFTLFATDVRLIPNLAAALLMVFLLLFNGLDRLPRPSTWRDKLGLPGASRCAQDARCRAGRGQSSWVQTLKQYPEIAEIHKFQQGFKILSWR